MALVREGRRQRGLAICLEYQTALCGRTRGATLYLLRNLDDPRRRLLVKLLAAGAFGTLPAAQALAQVLGEKPGKLPPGRSVYRVSGQAFVNGAPVTLRTPIGPTDSVETGKRSELVFAVGDNAYLLRESSRLNLAQQKEGNLLTDTLRLVTGALLAVFPPRSPRKMYTTTATLGIRGTGVYLEAEPEQTYFCTCYGITDITASNDRKARRRSSATHHDEPVYILAKAQAGKSIRAAPFINHTDQELMLIETLVGRQTPFAFPSDDYERPRKPYD